MDSASPCERCLAHPKPIDVPANAFAGSLPASLACLQSRNPREVMDTLRDAKTLLAARDVAAFRALEARISGAAVGDNPIAFLSTVILSLAARGRVRLFVVSHRPGWASRLFGKSPNSAIHIAPYGPDREDQGVVEGKLMAAVRSGSGPKMPHGPTVRRAIELLFASPVTNPGSEILTTAKEEAIANGIGRWTPKEEIPALAASSGGLVDGVLERLFERAIRGARFYQILPAREALVASELAAVEALRKEVSASDLTRIEDEIQNGLDARTYVPE